MSSNAPLCPFRTYRKIDDGAPAECFGAVGPIAPVNVRYWRKTNMLSRFRNVRFWG
jgi:hypothetical protein